MFDISARNTCIIYIMLHSKSFTKFDIATLEVLLYSNFQLKFLLLKHSFSKFQPRIL